MEVTAATVLAAAVSSGSNNSSDLLQGLVTHLWPHLNVAICQSIRESVTFEDLPRPLNTLRFTTLDLGSTPITIDNVMVHDVVDKSSLQFDLDIVWDGDCHIELQADYVGSIGVQKLKLYGRLSVVLAPLLDKLPVVSAVSACFVNPPLLELDFLGVANVADWSLVNDKIRGIIHDTIGDMLVLPNRMYSKVDPANSFLDTYQPPVGVVRVSVRSGAGFQGTGGGLLKEAHDVYCMVQFARNETWQTSTQNNTAEPVWNESKDFVLHDYDQAIRVQAWDEDVGGADDDLGTALVSVREVLLSSSNKTVTLSLHGGSYFGGQTVTIQCQVAKLVSSHQSLTSNECQTNGNICGLLTVCIAGARNIPVESKADAKTHVKVQYGSEHSFVTATVVDAVGVDALNPFYDKTFEIPLTFGFNTSDVVEVTLMNGEDVVGSATVTYDELTEAPNGTITSKEADMGGALLDFSVSLYGVRFPDDSQDLVASDDTTAHATSSSVTTRTAKGSVRLTILKGWGFGVETRRRRVFKRKDVPDAYCNVTFGSSQRVWRTSTIPNNLSPEWNESEDYLLSDHGQVVSITVFDADKRRDKDDELGGARVSIGKLLVEGTMDVELMEGGKPTGQFVSIKGDMLRFS